MNRKQLIKKYIEFFKSKNHKEIPNESLIPENDPTVLFTTAGMHPLVPYLLGQKHPLGKRLVNIQRCIRTGDIEEVGDSTHHTFFEMLGNWSLGDYWKKEAIEMSFEFLTKHLKIPIEKLAVTCFKGDKDAPKDNEAANVWKNLGIRNIAFLGKEDNWWGPAGKTGPCGPDTEMFYWNRNEPPKEFNLNDSTSTTDGEKWVEIWNDVLMQYNKNPKGEYEEAKQKNIDTGMGVERTLAILNGFDDNYLTEIWQPIIKGIEKLSKKKYGQHKRAMRIIADHIKASVFIIGDGITPSNTEQGYVLRKLIRKAVFYGRNLGIENFASKVAEPVFKIYDDCSELKKNKKQILKELENEEEKFNVTFKKGFKKAIKKYQGESQISSKEIFEMFQSWGLPKEQIWEILKSIKINISKKKFEKDFENELSSHIIASGAIIAGRFKSGLADNSEATTKLHTATHLLLKALQIVLKNENIIQKGSNITAERLRFDFAFNRKLTKEELKEIEDLVNAQIQSSCEIIREEMSPEQAKTQGACGIFDKKYGDKVSVYSIGNFSKEICAGPHTKNTCELGHFKIKKEESSSSGVRRIKAVLE